MPPMCNNIEKKITINLASGDNMSDTGGSHTAHTHTHIEIIHEKGAHAYYNFLNGLLCEKVFLFSPCLVLVFKVSKMDVYFQ